MYYHPKTQIKVEKSSKVEKIAVFIFVLLSKLLIQRSTFTLKSEAFCLLFILCFYLIDKTIFIGQTHVSVQVQGANNLICMYQVLGTRHMRNMHYNAHRNYTYTHYYGLTLLSEKAFGAINSFGRFSDLRTARP